LRIRIDDYTSTRRGATQAGLRDFSDKTVIIGDLLADLDIPQRDPPSSHRFGLRIPTRTHLGIRIAGVIEPPGLVDQVKKYVVAVVSLLARQNQGVGVVEIRVRRIQDAVANTYDFTALKGSGGAYPITVNR